MRFLKAFSKVRGKKINQKVRKNSVFNESAREEIKKSEESKTKRSVFQDPGQEREPVPGDFPGKVTATNTQWMSY